MTTQLFIPAINDQLTLAQDWSFKLYREHRNEPLFAALGLLGVKQSVTRSGISKQYQGPGQPMLEVPYSYTAKEWSSNINWDSKQHDPCTLPAGTVLTVRRIYIRQGLVDYNSVTFSIHKCPNKKLKGRFWAKLHDVNRLVVEDVAGARAGQVATAVLRKMGLVTMSGKARDAAGGE